MPVNPKLPRKILVVHGVQAGDNQDQNQHHLIGENIKNRIGKIPVRYIPEIYKYEDLNEKTQKKWKKLLKLIYKIPIGGTIAGKTFDIVADVVTAKLNTSTAHKIREGLRDKILDIYASGNPCYVVAHSLGSIYAFDVINDLMRQKDLFDRQSRKTWPIQGLVTLGSPIGVPFFKKGKSRRSVVNLGKGTKWFRWINYWDRTDPIVSGEIFGQQFKGYQIAEKYQKDSDIQGWVIRDRPIDTGKLWLVAHVAYWEHPVVGDGLVDLITN